MDVTEANLKQVLPEIQDSISKASFITFDTEFTGLSLKDATPVGLFDSAAEAYTKLRTTSTFSIVQFGLCTFHEVSGKPKTFTHRAYNCYILPRHETFLCQTESLTFLVQNGFDLNKVFKSGISCLTPKERDAKLQQLQEKRAALDASFSQPKRNSHIANIPEKEKELLETTRVKIEKFLNEEDAQELVLDKCNGFQRLLLYQMVEAHFEGKAYMYTRTDEKRNRDLVVCRGSEVDRLNMELTTLDEKQKNIIENSGFLAVLSAIKNSGKLLVGHNMFLDVLHTVNQFFEDVPTTLPAFKTLVHSKLPSILDTKMMACKPPLKDKVGTSGLDSLAKELANGTFKLTNAAVDSGGSGYDVTKDKAHEAGYDAYVTGLCFIAMANYLGSETKSFQEILDSDILKPYRNKLLYAPYADNGFLNLCGQESAPATDHVFHMRVPSEWKNGDVAQLFSPYGQVRVFWQGPEECLISLDNRAEAARVKEVMEKAARKSKQYKFQTFANYKAAMQSVGAGRRRRPSADPTQMDHSHHKKPRSSHGSDSVDLDSSTEKNVKMFEESASWD